MTSSAEQIIERLQTKFDPFVKPREQINYIRRVLALELGSYIGQGPIQQPLSLNQGPIERDPGPELKGLHREYVEALRANIAARQRFEEIAYGQEASSSPHPKPEGNSSVLEDHLAVSRLRKKRDSLVTVQSYLERLAELPAPPREVRDVEQMLSDGNPQPAVPAEVLNSFVVEQQTSAGIDIQSRISQLEKTVFRAKLLLKREENLLDDARARCKIKPELVSNGAKMEALNSTRNELINWIETELSKASAEEKTVAGTARQQNQTDAAVAAPDQAGISGQVRQVQDKYKAYVAARKKLLALTSSAPRPSMALPGEEVNDKATLGIAETRGSTTSIDHLLIPHIETLISQSRRQKGLITHKSHFSATLDKQRKDSCQLIGRLAEESQLLAAYPMKDSARRQSGVPEIITAKHADRPDLASRIKPWLFAADAAKIGTLDAVAENVEVGQIALENSMKSLYQIKTLLGVQDELEEDDDTAPDTTEGDMWLDDGMGKGNEAKKSHKKTVKAKSTVSQEKIDPWARLHGNLGLIGHDDVP
ncbi:hypothetical protein E4U43_007437 [Claviceps pusilla]|uniref:Uncharacterized protein n=1 Tax=Claviceps pusilla TaxID=123648 RepID=A0A9P7T1N5_9HYPO|nr:hypothetical protein E4U43_007437 [Claviceps pusilla]